MPFRGRTRILTHTHAHNKVECLAETTSRSLHLSALPLSFPSLHLPFWVCCKQAWAAGFPSVPPSPGSAYFSPAQEGWDVSDGDVASQSFDAQVTVVREEHHLPLEPHCAICIRSRAEVVKSICKCVKRQKGLHTFLIRHEVFSLVFAVVETARQNHIVVVSLK